MQTAMSWIRTYVVDSISYDDKHNTQHALDCAGVMFKNFVS